MTTHLSPSLSIRLKALGFDRPTRDYVYIGDTGNNVNRQFHTENADNHNEDELCVSLPTYSEFFAWCREVHGIDSWVESIFNFDNEKKYLFIIHRYDDSRTRFDTHPAAEQALAEKLVTILEEKNK